MQTSPIQIESRTISNLKTLDYDTESLFKYAESLRAQYLQNQPFPHIAIDGMFPTDLLDMVISEIDPLKGVERNFYGAAAKSCFTKRFKGGDATQFFLTELNSAEFITFLEKLTGIEGLVPDPYFEGGGIHKIRRGGFLKVHTDFNSYKKLKLDRRVNILIYLNKEWKEEYGGALELWSEDMKEAKQIIFPLYNRMVIFNSTDFSFHGHPDPLQCPPDRSRNSIALYYYTNGRPSNERNFRSGNTNYQARPNEKLGKPESVGDRVARKVLPSSAYNFIKEFAFRRAERKR